MDRFGRRDLELAHAETDERYLEVLRRDSMSVGIYRLPAGAEDTQQPHNEDEVYHVLAGRAKIRVGDEVNPVEPGDMIFVEREVNHEFFDIEEPLEVLVVFAPAEGTL